MRSIGVAALAAGSSVPLMFLTFIVLIGLFTEPGPIGAAEPRWAMVTAFYAPIVVTSSLAGAFYAGALPTRLWPHVAIGLLAGALLESILLGVRLANGDPFGSFAPAGYLVHPLLGASGSTLSGVIRIRRWRDYLDA